MQERKLRVLSAALLLHLLSVKGSPPQANEHNEKRGIIFPGAELSEKRGESCTTPSGRSGECFLITNCQELWKKRDFNLLRRSLCGFEGEQPKVCCPSAALSTARPLPVSDRDIPLVKANSNGVRRPLGGILPTSETPHNPPITSEGRVPSSVAAPASSSDFEGHRSGTESIKDLLPTECGRNKITIRRIVGGQESVVGAWPWMAAILLTRRGIRSAECGGAIVTPKHVITAAHCMVDSRRGTTLRANALTVRLGEHDLESDDDGASPIDVGVKSVIKHEDFVPRTFQNDIAILELNKPVEFKNDITPLCLPYDVFGGDDLARRNAFVAGWGTTSFSGPSSSKLQEVQLRIWNNSECKEVFKDDVPINNLNLCAGDGDKDSCRGDSGGPLMLPHLDGKFYMVGIVSFGKKCAEPGIPGVYTRVTSFLDWIERKIRATL